MTKRTFEALKDSGFNIILLKSTRTRYPNIIVYSWGWLGGHNIYCHKLLNDPTFIGETSVRGCADLYSDLMPNVSNDFRDISSRYIIGKNNGHKGRGKKVFTLDELPYETYQVYQEFIEPPRDEYRVLSCGEDIVISYRKDIPDPFNPETDKIFKCCNGPAYGIRNSEPEVPSIALDIARKVIERSNLDVLGQDIIVKDDRAYLIEINSAPGIGPTTAKYLMESIQRQWG
jgi:predicted ATP-grasp superfamily ATP-dependent carboligase